MDRRRSDQGWRAAALAAALFAITLNFLQPLAHAALMRDGGATAGTWAAMCLPSTSQPDDQTPASAATPHECCLGLAHASAVAEPSAAFVAIERAPTTVCPLETAQSFTPVGIRDGPSQPRAPPFPT